MVNVNPMDKGYMGNTFTGLTMIKDKLIKPLLIATERVVEYYFPEEKEEKSSEGMSG
jgi:hypothetical protein